MYEFTTLTGIAPSTGSSFGLIFNGFDLETSIPGFRTLTIEGRGMIGREIKSVSPPRRDGQILEYSNLPPRDITVNYSIKGDDASSLRRRYEELNAILHQSNLSEIKFKDDPGFHYKGILYRIREDDEDSNQIKGQIGFYCPMPFKYSDPVTKSGTTVTYPNNDYLIGVLGRFSFTANASLSTIKIQNDVGDSITIGPVVSGRNYILDIGDKINIYENGIRKIALLTITAGVERFRVEPGLIYSLSNGGSLQIEFREIRL